MPSPKSTEIAEPSEDLGAGVSSPRYARHLALPGFGAAGQAALAATRVLVVGAGGLGSPVLAYLAGAGVGMLGIVDDDVVETSNLQRQVIHRDDAVGQAKIDSAAAFVVGLNPQVRVQTHRVRLDAATALELLQGYDVVVDGTDNFETRYLLNDACVLLGLPLVWASISEYAGQLGVLRPGAGPCYRCLFPEPPAPGTVLNCAEGGVLGVLPGVIGTLQACEVIKVITGVGKPLESSVLLYDALESRTSLLDLRRDPSCRVCGKDAQGLTGVPLGLGLGPQVSEVGAQDLAATTVVIDVREPDEVAAHPLPGARLVPLSQWDPGAVERLARDLVDADDVVLVCASGMRSRDAARRLREAGLRSERLASLRGGVNALDPTTAHPSHEG